ncbi:MAG: hypothetical protein ACJ79H_23485 [Myxococcales bacterium]
MHQAEQVAAKEALSRLIESVQEGLRVLGRDQRLERMAQDAFRSFIDELHLRRSFGGERHHVHDSAAQIKEGP